MCCDQAPLALPRSVGLHRGAVRPACQSAPARRFLTSQAARNFVGFLLALNDAVRGKALSDPCPASPAVDALLEVRALGVRRAASCPPPS